MGIDEGASLPIHQLEPGECDLDETGPGKHHGDQMFRQALWRARDGTRLEYLCLVSFVILKNCICRRRETFTIADIWISVYRYHVGPSVEVLLLFGRELVLITLRP